jgi:hypothetical protein
MYTELEVRGKGRLWFQKHTAVEVQVKGTLCSPSVVSHCRPIHAASQKARLAPEHVACKVHFSKHVAMYLQVDAEMSRGALPGLLSLAAKLGPATQRVLDRTRESLQNFEWKVSLGSGRGPMAVH